MNILAIILFSDKLSCENVYGIFCLISEETVMIEMLLLAGILNHIS
jgi:hypothetical protein